MSTPQQADLPPPQEPAGPPEPQPVLNPLTRAAIFLVVAISPGGEPAARDVLGDLAALQRSVGFRAPDDTLACVAGVGSQAWDRLFAGPRPAELHPFRELGRLRKGWSSMPTRAGISATSLRPSRTSRSSRRPRGSSSSSACRERDLNGIV